MSWWASKKANKERSARDAAEQLAVTSPGGGTAPSRQQARRALDAQVGGLRGPCPARLEDIPALSPAVK